MIVLLKSGGFQFYQANLVFRNFSNRVQSRIGQQVHGCIREMEIHEDRARCALLGNGCFGFNRTAPGSDLDFLAFGNSGDITLNYSQHIGTYHSRDIRDVLQYTNFA